MANPKEDTVNLKITLTITESGATKDISAATTKQMVFYTPSASIKTLTAVFENTGTDGKLTYQTTAGFLTPGAWQVEPYLVFPGATSGFDGRGSTFQFQVDAKIK